MSEVRDSINLQQCEMFSSLLWAIWGGGCCLVEVWHSMAYCSGSLGSFPYQIWMFYFTLLPHWRHLAKSSSEVLPASWWYQPCAAATLASVSHARAKSSTPNSTNKLGNRGFTLPAWHRNAVRTADSHGVEMMSSQLPGTSSEWYCHLRPAFPSDLCCCETVRLSVLPLLIHKWIRWRVLQTSLC